MESESTIFFKIYSFEIIDPDWEHKIMLDLNSILICYICIYKKYSD